MKYTNEFKEKSQNELSKRLGYNSLVECIQSLGSKQFKRKCDEFYSEYFKEVNKNRFIVKKVTQPILKSEPSKRYINNDKAITKIEISLREMAKLIEQGKDNSVRLFISECFITNVYLTILRRLEIDLFCELSSQNTFQKYIYLNNGTLFDWMEEMGI